MQSVKKVKLGLNAEMEVVVTADVNMKHKADLDDVYFVMFNVLDTPLRFVVSTAGNFTEFLVERGTEETEINKWFSEETPDKFLEEVVQHQTDILIHSDEKVRVILDTQKNADLARVVVSSMIEKGYFINITNYNIPGIDEPVQKVQQVPTESLFQDFATMLEVIKEWENFDFEEFLRAKGVPEETIIEMLER
tara:strand:+ start:141 stop:719 length:579 start_codon:yes stop_codon:yes gene_type:complete